MSLRSESDRMEGNYAITKVIINGEEDSDSLEEYEGFEFILEKDGTGEMNFPFLGAYIKVNMEWEFNSDKTEFHTRQQGVNLDGTPGDWDEWSDYYTILKLTDTEVWYKETTEDGDEQEVHMEE